MIKNERQASIFISGLLIGGLLVWAFSYPTIHEITPEMSKQMTTCIESGGKYTFNNCKW